MFDLIVKIIVCVICAVNLGVFGLLIYQFNKDKLKVNKAKKVADKNEKKNKELMQKIAKLNEKINKGK